VGEQAFVVELPEQRRQGEDRIDASLLGPGRVAAALTRTQATDADDHRHAAPHGSHRRAGHQLPVVLPQVSELPGGPQRDHAVHPAGQHVLDEGGQGRRVDRTGAAERGQQGHVHAADPDGPGAAGAAHSHPGPPRRCG